MTTTDTPAIARAAAKQAKNPRRSRLLIVLCLLNGFMLLLTTAIAVVFVVQGEGYRSIAATNTSVAQQLASQLYGLGKVPVASPVPGPAGTSGATGAQGPGPTQQQIDDAVNRYLAAHPPAAGRSVTPAMVAYAVAAYLTQHPPAPGRAPTADEIATAASTYISAHPDQFTGPAGTNGSNGADGANATDAQVAAAVQVYCSSHNDCTGPTGAQGDQGIGESDLVFTRDPAGTCMAVVTLHDPATNTDTTVSHPAGDAACPLPNPPVTTAPSGLLGGPN